MNSKQGTRWKFLYVKGSDVTAKGVLLKDKINILLVGSPTSRGLCTLLNEFFDTKPNYKRDLFKQLR